MIGDKGVVDAKRELNGVGLKVGCAIKLCSHF